MISGLNNRYSANISIPHPLLWYDVADTASFTFSTGAFISQWLDRSGNGYHLQQSTGANQPSLAVASLAGLPSIRFATGLSLATPLNVPYGLCTVFVVGISDAASNSFFCGRAKDNENHDALSLKTSVYSLSFGRGNSHESAALFTTDYSGSWAVFGLSDDGSQLGLTGYKNSIALPATQVGSGIPGSTIISTPFLVGAQAFVGGLNGNIAEIILYDTVLPEPDRYRVYMYLANKWAL